MEQLDDTRLIHMRSISHIPYDKYFLTTLIEHWCDDTNICHLSTREITITLVDIHRILWVPMKGTLVQRVTLSMAKMEE